ncbi:MAG: c-type cytochrome [Anaerolineales bacterium]|nr:c-type cytochrome [Chloroflexota bacterium]MBL6979591.1 c-type cytochrome [Anaerolineales bacterium]
MRKILKWIGIGLGVLVGLVVIFVGVMFTIGTSRLNKTYAVQPAAISIPEDAAALERGAYLYAASCAGCHGDDLAGTVIFDDPAIGYTPAGNLTSGKGGVGISYSDVDFVRAIRHGIAADGRPLMIMPSKGYWYFSDGDLGAIIAYLKSAPPVENELGVNAAKPMGKILIALGLFGDVLSAEVIDHQAPRPSAPARGVTTEYGEYLVNTGDCSTCHGPDLAGQQSPEPGSPFSSNLTPGGVLAIWTAEEFIETMRTGTTPYGRQLDPAFMPWKSIANMTDDDLTAMFMYLQSLPALETPSK